MTKIESSARKLVERKMGPSSVARIDAQEDGSFEVFGPADNKHFLRVGKIGLRKVSLKDDGHNSPPAFLSMGGVDVFLKGGMYRVKGSAKVPKKCLHRSSSRGKESLFE